MSQPTAESIPRTGAPSPEPGKSSGTARWDDVAALLRAGSATTWLSVRAVHGVHTRPIFAAWTGATFVFASNPDAAKTRRLEVDGDVSLAIALEGIHLVVEGTAVRLTSPADLERARVALLEVYEWPTEVTGDLLDAPYAAPTSGGPPFQAWEITVATAIALPTDDDQVDPTRFSFE